MSTAYQVKNLPSDMREHAEDPRIIEAEITISNPVFNNPNDPFIDMMELVKEFGAAMARKFALKHSAHIENTGNWIENFSDDFSNVEDLLTTKPAALNRLYMDAYPLLDDKEFVDLARQAGYDGAIHVGNGESACKAEYRVFGLDQIRVRQVIEVVGPAQREAVLLQA